MKNKQRLTTEVIVDVSIRMIDELGPQGFTMRKLAAELNVDPMAIYYHIPSKADLIANVLHRVLNDFEQPQIDDSWQNMVKAICRSFRRLARKHPGVIKIFDTHEEWVQGELTILEALHLELRRAGFSDNIVAMSARLLFSFTENFCSCEMDGWIGPATSDSLDELGSALKRGDFPVLSSLAEEVAHVDLDKEFNFGLETIINGLEVGLKSM